MSLINFLNPKLKPSVESAAVCEDGYGVSNLIADDADQLARGFMAFSVTKPPVDIIFDFPKAIDLKVIKLWNNIGALRSTAFEVHGKFNGIWERVAFVRELDKDIDSVTFCYQSDYSSRNNAANAASWQQSTKVFFFRTAHKILANTTSIKITIRGTQKCPPVLRKIEVWGLPSRSLDKADRELMKTIWQEITYDQSAVQHQAIGERSPTRNVPELNAYSSLKIPEEFLDAITWELMIFPTVLPSGKVVDQSTIDKHSEEESKWGRMPSDPFTGLEYTSYRKAILHLGLKARIEKFLMDNSEHFKTVPRSLGSSRVRRSKNRHASQFASLHHSYNSSAGEALAPGTYSSLSASYKTQLPTKRNVSASFTISSPTVPAKRARHYASGVYNSKLQQLTSTATQTSATATSSFTSPTSAALATTAIDKALQMALHKITCYTKPPTESEPASCINCKSEEYAYKIQTCEHLVCRVCLVKLSHDLVCACKRSFRNADVERYHKL